MAQQIFLQPIEITLHFFGFAESHLLFRLARSYWAGLANASSTPESLGDSRGHPADS